MFRLRHRIIRYLPRPQDISSAKSELRVSAGVAGGEGKPVVGRIHLSESLQDRCKFPVIPKSGIQALTPLADIELAKKEG